MKRVVDGLYGIKGYPCAARFAEFKVDLFANGNTGTPVNITSATYRGVSIGTKGKSTDGSLAITATLPFDTEPANNYLLGVFSKVANTAVAATDDLGSAWLRTRVNAGMATNAGYSLFGVKSQLRIYADTALATTISNWAAAGILGVLEVSGATTTFASGCVAAAGYFNVALTTTSVIADGAIVAGVAINSASAVLTHAYAGYYGLYVSKSGAVAFDDAIHLNAGCATNIFRAGKPSTTVGDGFRIGTAYDATGAPFGIYFDDGGVALTSWGEGFTVGLCAKTTSPGGAQTGMPYTSFFYTDVEAAMDGKSTCGWSTVMASFIVGSGAFSGFEVGCSAIHASVDVNSSIAADVNLSCISFGGNWPGTITSGASLTPLFVRATNQSWTAFLKIMGNSGCYQSGAAGSSNHLYLKVYVGADLYTIDMVK